MAVSWQHPLVRSQYIEDCLGWMLSHPFTGISVLSPYRIPSVAIATWESCKSWPLLVRSFWVPPGKHGTTTENWVWSYLEDGGRSTEDSSWEEAEPECLLPRQKALQGQTAWGKAWRWERTEAKRSNSEPGAEGRVPSNVKESQGGGEKG